MDAVDVMRINKGSKQREGRRCGLGQMKTDCWRGKTTMGLSKDLDIVGSLGLESAWEMWNIGGLGRRRYANNV